MLNRHVTDPGKALNEQAARHLWGHFTNLDESLPGRLTTTEHLCKHVFDALAKAARAGYLGPGSEGIERIRVKLNESHVARAWFEGAV